MENSDTLLLKLEEAMGPKGLVTGEAVRQRATSWQDSSPCQALAVLRPERSEQVAAALAVCHEHRVQVVPVGGGTGLVGAVRTESEQVALSLERMNRILAIDPQQKTAIVEAGAPLQAVQEQASEHGCHFAVDLGARGSATIGGMVSTNAGGTEVLRFGMMREQVLGLEVVLADGRVLSSMRPLLKNNTGYDLKQLFIGAEGTLGIVTKVLLRLRAKPTSVNTALLAVASYQRVMDLLAFLQERCGQSLACFEVLWESFYQQILEHNPAHRPPFAQPHPYNVLVESTGSSPRQDQEAFQQVLEVAAEQGLIEDAVICNSLEQKKSLWSIRDDIDTLVESLESAQMFDISLPLQHIDSYVCDLTTTLRARYEEANVVTFGHVGDGNIHLAISLGRHLPAEKAWLEQEVYQPLGALGGSVSAEHGIGLDKKAFLHLIRSDDEIEIMRQLKALFDPRGILSPGRIF